ncbi:alpha-amylase family glycosyl hydrolase [Alphaproteobacteria bacterium]|nr:alpha-amylase family glycosyl hydrolase [Alphaproteobacteria bacterium]
MKNTNLDIKNIDQLINEKLLFIYRNEKAGFNIKYYSNIILNLIKTFQKDYKFKKKIISEKTFLLISYGDNLKNKNEVPLKVLKNFFEKNLKTFFEILHVLPFYPSSSDGGFSVTDHKNVNKDLGTWNDIRLLSNHASIMADLILNHSSIKGKWFNSFIKEKEDYKNFFFTIDDHFDFSKVIRPRDHKLIQIYNYKKKNNKLWCTFSHDQIDLNFKDPLVLIEFIEIVLLLLSKGVTTFRLDAVAFIWKKNGTSCVNLPETHEIVKLLRLIVNYINPHALIVTETNLPRKENISYFGNNDEANWIYNFPLPPLILYTFLFEDSSKISGWSKSMPPAQINNAYLNFIASHDGIGMRPAEGILNNIILDKLFKRVKKNGGKFSFRKVETKNKVYEVNITLFDALKRTDFDKDGIFAVERYIAAHAILLALEGVPAIYFNSLFGTSNDQNAFINTGIKRNINRFKWDFSDLSKKLKNKNSLENVIYSKILKIISLRQKQIAFHPNATQYTLTLGNKLFGVWRQSIDRSQNIFAITNISSVVRELKLSKINLFENQLWFDLLKPDESLDNVKILKLKPFQTVWISNKKD